MFVLSSSEQRPNAIKNYLVTNYPDILIRDMIVDGAPDHNLILRELPKDELKLSNFITNWDDFIYHEISRNHRNMNSKEGATLLTMQWPKNSQKKEDMT